MALWFLSTRASRRMSLPDAVRCCRLRTRVPRSLERKQRLQQHGTQHQRLHPGGREQQGLGSPLAASRSCGCLRCCETWLLSPEGAWQPKQPVPTRPAAGHAATRVMLQTPSH